MIDRNTFVLEINEGEIRKTDDRIHLACGQHRLAYREADGINLNLGSIDAVCPHENGPLRISAVVCRADRFAFEVFRLVDAAALAADHRKGRTIVEHEHGLDWRGPGGVPGAVK